MGGGAARVPCSSLPPRGTWSTAEASVTTEPGLIRSDGRIHGHCALSVGMVGADILMMIFIVSVFEESWMEQDTEDLRAILSLVDHWCRRSMMVAWRCLFCGGPHGARSSLNIGLVHQLRLVIVGCCWQFSPILKPTSHQSQPVFTLLLPTSNHYLPSSTSSPNNQRQPLVVRQTAVKALDFWRRPRSAAKKWAPLHSHGKKL